MLFNRSGFYYFLDNAPPEKASVLRYCLPCIMFTEDANLPKKVLARVNAVTTVKIQRSWLVKATTTGYSLNKAIGV